MRLGIMGGTFDPIHIGHVAIARLARAEAGLERVIFLPDGDPPHKSPRASGAHRLEMARLATEGEGCFEVSDMELSRPGRTYTVDSLTALTDMYPGSGLHYIIGSDTLFQFPTWKTAEKVARLCRMLVALRPGDDGAAIRAQQEDLLARYGLQTALLRGCVPDVSSSRIRALAREGRSIDGLVPPPVAAYIAAHGLYRGPA
ncbi:MAG TPA: nicotinate-nucleotide adenylyltransferase [Candidatus Limnocylindria bacterium]|nr:nicotinate-nucleotide adenylyltransferase [Candidatus Limnocylindria bacterium]